MENVDDKIIDRIKKLLALGTNNSNEHEAAIAMRRAHALLAEYNLTMEQLTEHEREAADPYVKGFQHWPQMKGNATSRVIAHSIAKLYFCKMFVRGLGNKGDDFTFVGRKNNVAVALQVTESVIMTLRTQARIEAAGRSGFATDFMNAAGHRVAQRCNDLLKEAEEGKTKDESGTNLPALRNTYLAEQNGCDQFLQSQGIKLKGARGTVRGDAGTGGAAAGRQAGGAVSLRPGIGRSSQNALK